MRIWYFSIALAVLLLVLCVSFFTRTVDAADGDLDLTFGAGGKALVDFGRYSRPLAVALQPDAKILVVGQVGFSDSSADFAVARLNSDGSPDNSFGNQGLVTTDINNGDRAYAVALQSDGKILVAGVTNASYGGWEDGLRGGSLDSTFGNGGKWSKDVASNNFDDEAHAVTLQSNGKIVIAGYAWPYDFALTRLNIDGSLDTSFGQGVVLTDFNLKEDRVSGLTIQPDGRLIAFGSNTGFEPISPGQWELARFRRNFRHWRLCVAAGW